MEPHAVGVTILVSLVSFCSSHSCHRCHLRLESSVAAEPRWAIGRFYPSVAASEAIREIAWESDRRFAGRAIEVRHRLRAACEGSFANARVRIEQKRFRFLYSDSREVIDETYPRGFLEHLAKVIAVLLITPCDAVRLTNPCGSPHHAILSLRTLSATVVPMKSPH